MADGDFLSSLWNLIGGNATNNAPSTAPTAVGGVTGQPGQTGGMFGSSWLQPQQAGYAWGNMAAGGGGPTQQQGVLQALGKTLSGLNTGNGNSANNPFGLNMNTNATAAPANATTLPANVPHPTYAGTGGAGAAAQGTTPVTLATAAVNPVNGGTGAALGPAASNPLLALLQQRFQMQPNSLGTASLFNKLGG